MTQFKIHTVESAPEEGKEILEQAKKKFGMIPNLMGALVEAPVAAEAYAVLSELVVRSSFTPTERHVVWFTINAYHNCEYCMSAHSALAAAEKIDAIVVETARSEGHYEDPKLEALRTFALLMTENRGWVEQEAIEVFLNAGFTKQNVLELVTVIAQKVISNYANHLIETPVDAHFAKFHWSKQDSAA